MTTLELQGSILLQQERAGRLTVGVVAGSLASKQLLAQLDCFDLPEGLVVRKRITTLLAGLIMLSMVMFGQVCGLSTLTPSWRGTESEFLTEVQPVETAEHEDTCTPEDCGGDDEEQCPSGASMCCSTWAPPGARLSLPNPTSFHLALSHAWLALACFKGVDDGAPGVALFELARPPGPPSNLLLTSSLSHRGPPALS